VEVLVGFFRKPSSKTEKGAQITLRFQREGVGDKFFSDQPKGREELKRMVGTGRTGVRPEFL